jgi:hypothetical protein
VVDEHIFSCGLRRVPLHPAGEHSQESPRK